MLVAMLGSKKKMGNETATVLPSKNLQSGGSSKRACECWAQNSYAQSTMGAKVRPAPRIREGFSEKVINT